MKVSREREREREKGQRMTQKFILTIVLKHSSSCKIDIMTKYGFIIISFYL